MASLTHCLLVVGASPLRDVCLLWVSRARRPSVDNLNMSCSAQGHSHSRITSPSGEENESEFRNAHLDQEGIFQSRGEHRETRATLAWASQRVFVCDAPARANYFNFFRQTPE